VWQVRLQTAISVYFALYFTDSDRLHHCCHLLNKAENIQHTHDITYTYRGLGDVPLSKKLPLPLKGSGPPNFMLRSSYPQEFPKYFFHSCGTPVIFIPIPAGFPECQLRSPLETCGNPVVPIPLHVSNLNTSPTKAPGLEYK